MIVWTIKRILDSVEQPYVSAKTTFLARKAMLSEIEQLISEQPEEIKIATRSHTPQLSSPAWDRWRQYIIYLNGEIGNTSYVLVEAMQLDMYP